MLDYRPNTGMGTEELETIQAGMLELVMPVLPHRLSEDWRKVIEQMDFLDVPGMRAVRTGIEQGKRTEADTLEEQMEIVKRGKVSYLFERFVDELQIQTLFLLLRGGNLEVKAQMKYHVEKWGKARYGEKVWPHRVQDEIPALFIGMSGLDEEFRNREIFAEKILYDTRLNSILDTLGNVMTDFGGKGKAVHQRLSHPLSRHVGHQRGAARRTKTRRNGPAPARRSSNRSWSRPTSATRPLRWDTAMKDGDGGQSLISVRHPRRHQRRRQAGPVDQGDRRRPEPALAAFPRLGRRPRHEHRPRAAACWRPRRSSTGSRPTRSGSTIASTPWRSRSAWPRARNCRSPIAPTTPAAATATRCPRS